MKNSIVAGLFIFCMLFNIVVVSSVVDLEEGLVSYWPLDSFG